MTVMGCDTAANNLDYGAVRDHGLSFVARYASDPGNPKNLTAAEADRAHNAGIRLVSVFETTAERSLAGSPAGRADAQAAAEWFYQCGQPFGTPIYYTVDFDMTSAQFSAVEQYFIGLRQNSAHYTIGVYGGVLACQLLTAAHRTDHVWQTRAWSHGIKLPAVDIYQNGEQPTIGGAQVDIDAAFDEAYGGWFPVTPGQQPPVVPPAPPNQPVDWMTTIMDRLPTLQQGAKDPVAGQAFVRRAQAILRDVAGITVGDAGVDGNFGPLTLGAVKGFQSSRHLTVDGIIGPKTWSYLITGTAL